MSLEDTYWDAKEDGNTTIQLRTALEIAYDMLIGLQMRDGVSLDGFDSYLTTIEDAIDNVAPNEIGLTVANTKEGWTTFLDQNPDIKRERHLKQLNHMMIDAPMRPMTEEEVAAAAADPDARPMTPEELKNARRRVRRRTE